MSLARNIQVPDEPPIRVIQVTNAPALVTPNSLYFYIGPNARFVALANGMALEVFDGATWVEQFRYTE